MTFKEFIEKYKPCPEKFCIAVGISMSTYANLRRGKARPYQRTAEAIEKFTKGLVTVKELRGYDDREEFIP